MKDLLTRDECNALRGAAIIGIFLHNFCHWLPGIVRENEYLFREGNVAGLQGVLAAPDELLPVQLFSFFGHYGVPLFLFLSAYGLVMKYERGAVRPAARIVPAGAGVWTRLKYAVRSSQSLGFIGSHFLKLFRMMVVGFVAFTMVDAVTPGRHHYDLLAVVAQLGLFNNLLPAPNHVIWPGPYWFFGLMLQLYVVYRLLLYRRHWGWTVGLMVACTALQMVCGPESDELNRLRYNFVGGMLPFGYGLLCARMPMQMPRSYSVLFGLLSLWFVYSLSLGYMRWFFVPLFVCSAGFCLVKVLPRWVLRPLEWTGGVSAALFVCHPITRKIFLPVSNSDGIYVGLLLYVVASLVLALLFREVLRRVAR